MVNNYLEDKESSNVIGVIRGEVEPDRYIVIGKFTDGIRRNKKYFIVYILCDSLLHFN